MARDYWLQYAPVAVIDKIKKSLTIPPFSYNCGPKHQSIRCAPGDALGTTTALGFTDALTIEFWAKSFGQESTSAIYFSKITDYSQSIDISWNSLTNTFGATIVTTTDTFVASGGAFPFNQWFHVAMTWKQGGDLKLYVNGELFGSVPTTGSYLDGNADLVLGGSAIDLGMACFAYFNELRIWNEERSQQDIQRKMYSRCDPTNLTEDANLKYYWKFDEASTATRVVDCVSGLYFDFAGYDPQNVSLVDTEFYPFSAGSSFVVAEAEIDLGTRTSIRWPVTYVSPDHMLTVRDVKNGSSRRFRLYGDALMSPYPADYIGQALEYPFYLEFWNVDGNATINNTSNLTLRVTKTTDPATSTDTTAKSASAVTMNTNLAANFPLVFPVTFDQPLGF